MTLHVTPEHLRERFTRYLRTHDFNGRRVRDVLNEFQILGRVAVFGGFTRDMAASGAAGFRSDIDVVVECEAGRLDAVMEQLPADVAITRNKFGGYRLSDSHALLDVWSLETTWAIRQHYATPSLDQLPKTTFFNWDAIAYCLSTRELIFNDGYFEQVKARFLDLNLRDNPNPAAMCVRALKIACKAPTRFSRPLVSYVLEHGAHSDQLSSYTAVGLTREFVVTCLSRMERFMRSSAEDFTCGGQLALPFQAG